MAKAEFKPPELKPFAEIPVLVEGAMAHSRPYVASPQHQEALGYPGELLDDWQRVAIEKMGEVVGKYR